MAISFTQADLPSPIYSGAEAIATFEMFPGARIGFAFPFARKSKELEELVRERECSFKLSEASYLNHNLPDPFELKRGGRVYKPPEWS